MQSFGRSGADSCAVTKSRSHCHTRCTRTHLLNYTNVGIHFLSQCFSRFDYEWFDDNCGLLSPRPEPRNLPDLRSSHAARLPPLFLAHVTWRLRVQCPDQRFPGSRDQHPEPHRQGYEGNACVITPETDELSVFRNGRHRTNSSTPGCDYHHTNNPFGSTTNRLCMVM
jgi:hypothetical protein